MKNVPPPDLPIRVGISTCLLGEKVRFDSGHKKDRYLTDVLGAYFEWVPVCPELEVGMGVPREAVRLVGDGKHPRMIGVKTGEDWTGRMVDYSAKRVAELDEHYLSGYILKSDSPSCGMERVRIYNVGGMPSKQGRGLFAAALMERFPYLPVEEEGRLHDALLRENFIERVFAYHRLQTQLLSNFNLGSLVRFHTINKYLMLSHSPKHYAMLGNLVGGAKRVPRQSLRESYVRLYMEGMAVKATVSKHSNVLYHILGFLKDELTDLERKSIIATIEDYRHALIPLVVPLTLLKHYVEKRDIAYIREQRYINPHPKELMLRNHV